MSFYWNSNPGILYEDEDTALEDIDLYIDSENYSSAFTDLITDGEYSWAAIRSALNGTTLGQTIIQVVEEIAEEAFVEYNLMNDGED